MIIKTPWKCEKLKIRTCSEAVVINQCPKDFVLCCYLCSDNEKCCDRCTELSVTEKDIKEGF